MFLLRLPDIINSVILQHQDTISIHKEPEEIRKSFKGTQA
jgi:hypothetical protein